jgi:solute carrier family 35, member F1/2
MVQCCLLQSLRANAIVRGQLISILIAGTGVFATFLSANDTNFPTLMSMCNYALLSTYLVRYYYYMGKNMRNIGLAQLESTHEHSQDGFSPVDAASHSAAADSTSSDHRDAVSLNQDIQEKHIPWQQWYWYMAAALLDVEANYLVILAYNYTSITSIMLLDCFTIPCAMVLSYTFLSCRYTKRHLAGTSLCIFGLVCIVISDTVLVKDGQGDDGSSTGTSDSGNHAWYGDVLCLVGSALYACSNVLQESMVKFHNREQYLGLLGSFGALIALVQCLSTELTKIERTEFSSEVILYIVGFVTCLFLMYINTSAFLQQGDAILFNLSLLTSDVYAVIFSYFITGHLVPWMYFFAFFLVAVGLYTYHSEKPPIVLGQEQMLGNGESGKDYRGVDDTTTGFRQYHEANDATSPYRHVVHNNSSLMTSTRGSALMESSHSVIDFSEHDDSRHRPATASQYDDDDPNASSESNSSWISNFLGGSYKSVRTLSHS